MMRSLRKVVAISWFLLSLAASCIPVYASPTKKDVTLDCGSVSPDVVVGNAIVTLCPSSGSSGVCALGQTSVVCPAVSCDSSGTTAPVSMTVSCAAGFKVAGLTSNMSFVEYDGNGNQVDAEQHAKRQRILHHGWGFHRHSHTDRQVTTAFLTGLD
jgi:hypothetical protein